MTNVRTSEKLGSAPSNQIPHSAPGIPALLAALPPQTQIRCVRLRTADVSRALAFYTSVLGLEITRRAGASVSLSATKQEPPLLVLTEDRTAAPRPARATGLYHFALRYPSRRALAQALLRLVRNRCPIHGASDHVVSEALYLSDPEGNGVELYADRPRSQWVWHDGQVEMATEALDLENLLAAAEGEPEASTPLRQTDIGHIHLHVADLALAERFYHNFLGLAVTQRSYPGALFFSTGGYHHHIAANTWAGKSAAPENSVGLISYRLEVPTIETLGGLRERAMRAGYETKAEPEPGQALLQIRDPNRNWLEIGAPCQG